MKEDVAIKNGIIIPGNELEITTSRAGGPGGQHVNKTDTRITVRWNVQHTIALNDIQKERVLMNLQPRLTTDGDLIINNSASRSQQQNKKNALAVLVKLVRSALYVPKKRIETKISSASKKVRLESKKHHGSKKKLRSKKIQVD
jgi:ribosome-associated protein